MHLWILSVLVSEIVYVYTLFVVVMNYYLKHGTGKCNNVTSHLFSPFL